MISSLTSLEFDRVLSLIALEARTSLGREAVARRKPRTTVEQCERVQSELAEMTRFHLSEGSLPLAGLADVTFITQKETVLELSESWQVVRAVRATQALRETLTRSRDSYPRLASIAAGIDDLSQLASDAGRFFTRDGKLREEASAELRSLRTRITGKRSAIQKALSELMNRHADAVQEPIITLRGDRYCIPVRTDHRSSVPGILHERSGSGASLFIEPMQIVELNNDLAELLIAEREEIARILRHISNLLVSSAEPILASTRVAGELDALQACAVIGVRIGAKRPLFSSTRELRLLGGRHPLLDERLADLRREAFGEAEETSVVPVSMTLEPDKRALLITGPNAGGKTVALKTAGLLVAMAASGLPVPAEDGTVIPVVDALHVLIGDDQSLLEHLSTFTAYLTRLKRVLNQATERSLVLLDELGSGTDPEEGAAIAAATIEFLLERGPLLVVTTHLSALKTFAMTDDRLSNAGMEFDPATGRPTYRMMAGIPGRSRAIEVAEFVGLPPAVTTAARERLGQKYGEIDSLIGALRARMDEVVASAETLRRERETVHMATQELESKLRDAEEQRRNAARSLREEIDRLKDEVANRLQAELRHLRELDRRERERVNARDRVETVTRPIQEAPIMAEPRTAIELGDQVQHRRLKMKGKVVSIDGSRVQLSVGGKNVRAELEDLMRIQSGDAPESREARRPQRPPSSDGDAEVSAELNLIGQRVDDAIEESDKFLDRSLLQGRQAVRIIHGFGSGALRKGLREHLRKHPAVRSFRPGNEREGGDGATVVVLDV